MTKTAVVLLAPGFEEIEATCPIDVLRRAGVEVTVTGLLQREVVAAHDMTFIADTTLAELAITPDALILPGGMPGSKNLGESAAARTLAEHVHTAGGWLCSLCAAPALTLAAWGLLGGKQATCYPGFEENFPADVIHRTDRVVVDAPFVTSRGPGTALDFALCVAAQLAGTETASTLRNRMVAD